MTQEEIMKQAIILAKKAEKHNEVPVGAIIIKDDKIIAEAFNKRETSKDATSHAEILAIKKACKKIKDFRLIDCDIYVTLEPCMMCLGAILNARIRNVYFGAYINKENSFSSQELVDKAELNHKCNIFGGILEKECSELVSNYFKSKRKK